MTTQINTLRAQAQEAAQTLLAWDAETVTADNFEDIMGREVKAVMLVDALREKLGLAPLPGAPGLVDEINEAATDELVLMARGEF